MQPSKEMKSVIDKIANRHSFQVWQADPGDCLKVNLDLGDVLYYPLVIEKLTETTVRIAHEVTDDASGVITVDPEVKFFVGYREWIAMELSQPTSLITSIGLPETNQRSVWLMPDGRTIKSYDPTGQKNIASFVKVWAKQLKDAAWPELSTDADDYQQTSFGIGDAAEQIVRRMDREARRDGISVTVSSGGQSATIGKH
jgi:hypothetical protein